MYTTSNYRVYCDHSSGQHIACCDYTVTESNGAVYEATRKVDHARKICTQTTLPHTTRVFQKRIPRSENQDRGIPFMFNTKNQPVWLRGKKYLPLVKKICVQNPTPPPQLVPAPTYVTTEQLNSKIMLLTNEIFSLKTQITVLQQQLATATTEKEALQQQLNVLNNRLQTLINLLVN